MNMHGLNNRSRRIARRILQIQADLKSIDRQCAAIEDNEDESLESRNAQISRLRRTVGPMQAQLRALLDRAQELPKVAVSVRPSAPDLGIPMLSQTENFPAAFLKGREGKCSRAAKVTRGCYAV